MSNLNMLKALVFESDNKACFIERERILNRLEHEMQEYTGHDKYALILSKLLSEVSTPVLECDYFAGRAVEALPDSEMKVPSLLLCSVGHMSFDYEKVLKMGLKGILKEIKSNAAKKGEAELDLFAKNAEIVVAAIRDYAGRYAETAENMGFYDMAKALRTVPYEPAYDFYSALQGIWIIHFIASCYVGSRDYAFGRFDRYMLPFYKQAIAQGKTKQEIIELLAGFIIKTNEICGQMPHNYNCKPVLCHSSKQYINIGGEEPNEFSNIVLEAAKLLNMAQPQITVLLKPDADETFTENVFEALAVLTDKMNIYNYDLIKNTLLKKGICEDVAKDFTYSACCTFDLNYHSFRLEHFTPVPQLFVKTLEDNVYASNAEIISAFKKMLKAEIQGYVDITQQGFDEERSRREFVLDGLLLSDSAAECRYACDGRAKYNVLNIFCPGIATIGDSLMVLDKLIFRENRYTYTEFMQILKKNFEGFEDLRQEIMSYTKFGNDTDADAYTVMAATAFVDVVESLELKSDFYAMPGFYSLAYDNLWNEYLGATPDGRKKGAPFSENQSPTYGADKSGITALLKSLAKLPFDRTVTGGLNLTFSQKMSAEVFRALIVSYFQLGGFHTGISVIDRETLNDAMVNPEKYKSLTVRLYGFSEYFVNLPKWQQIAVLNRTQYN